MAAVAACGSSGSSTKSVDSAKSNGAKSTSIASTAWSVPNGNNYNDRVAPTSISSANVSKLGVAWTLPIKASLKGSQVPAGSFGVFTSTPVFGSDGTVYLEDLAYNVTAVNSKTGKVKWRHVFNMPSEGPNGLTLVDDVLYGTTPTFAWAMNPQTGKLIWKSKRLIETKADASDIPASLINKGIGLTGQGLNIPPMVNGGKVFLSTSGQSIGGMAFALSAKTGKILWSFNETKNPKDRKVGGNNGTGGAWNSAMIGPDGTVYFGIANPYQSIKQAIDHPSRILYNDSTIALNPDTGKLKWYMQGVPNDFHDWDMQLSPVYADYHGRHIVLDSGKMGFVFAMNATTGKLLWKRSVGIHNGHDNDGLLALEHKIKVPTKPYIEFPGGLGGVESDMAYDDGIVYAAVNNLGTGVVGAPNQVAPSPVPKGGEMVALNVTTGKVLWDTKLAESPYGAATVANDLVFTTTSTGQVLAFNRKTGKQVWSVQLPGGTNSPISVSGDMLIAAVGLSGPVKPEIVAYRIGATRSATPTTTSATTTGSSTSTSGGNSAKASVAAGKTVFASNCSGCHTLASAGAHGNVGPNLDQLKPTDAAVVKQVTNGGGGMPAFKGNLSATQIQSVAKFVSSTAGKASASSSQNVSPP